MINDVVVRVYPSTKGGLKTIAWVPGLVMFGIILPIFPCCVDDENVAPMTILG